MTTHRATTVLLVEDSPGDARLFHVAFAASDVPGTLHHASDGEAALAFLRGEGEPERAPDVDLVVLDLDLPDTHGAEIIGAVRADPSLRTIPVIVLSSSAEPDHVEEAYERGANAYLVKRDDFDELLALVESIGEFWFEEAELPPG